MDDLYFWWRAANAVVSLLAAVVLTVVTFRRVKDKQLDASEFLFRIGAILFLLAGAYAAVDLHRVGAPGNLIRLAALSVSLVWISIGIVMIERKQRHDRAALAAAAAQLQRKELT